MFDKHESLIILKNLVLITVVISNIEQLRIFNLEQISQLNQSVLWNTPSSPVNLSSFTGSLQKMTEMEPFPGTSSRSATPTEITGRRSPVLLQSQATSCKIWMKVIIISSASPQSTSTVLVNLWRENKSPWSCHLVSHFNQRISWLDTL